MGKKDKSAKKKGKGAEKTLVKTDKKLIAKQKKLLEKIGEEDIQAIVARQEEELSATKQTVEVTCAPPSPRANFAICSLKEEIFIFGGEFFNGQKTEVYGEFFCYNTTKNEWKQIKSKGPTPRSGAQICSVETDSGQLWLSFGEYASPSQLQFIHFKDLWVWRMAQKQWEKIQSTNAGPSARSGHRMVASKKKLFVFGGFHDNNQTYKYFNDVFVFSLESYIWIQVQVSGTAPCPRSGCLMTAAQDGKILVWGGFSKTAVKKGVDRGVSHADMFTLLPEKGDTTGLKYKWSLVKPGGSKPLPRSGMSLAVAANGKAYAFGGVLDTKEDEEDLEGQFGNDLHMLDVNSQVWRKVELAKSKKKESDKEKMEIESQQSKTVSTDGIFTVTVGGSKGTSSTSSMMAKDDIQNLGFPSPRMNAGLAICKGILYIYGGLHEQGSKQYTLSDFYSLDLHKLDSFKTLIANSTTQEWLGSDSEDESDSDDDGLSDSENSDSDDDDEEEDSDEMDTD